MLIWVVTGEQGQYSDYSNWVVGVADSLESAVEVARSERPKENFVAGDISDIGDIEPGVTQVYLGEIPARYYSVDYHAEAFRLGVNG